MVNARYNLTAFFNGVTGLRPDIFIWDMDGNPPRLVVDTQRMTELDRGFYYYPFEHDYKPHFVAYAVDRDTIIPINMNEWLILNRVEGLPDSVASEPYATANKNAIISAVQSIQNNTTRRIDVPVQLIRPESDSKAYRILLGLYDMQGNPESPDLIPTITVTNIGGIVRLPETSMVQFTGQVGQYYYDYVLSTEAPLESQIVTIKVIELSVTTYHKRTTEIVDATTELDLIKDQITALTQMVGRMLGLTHENIYVRYTFSNGKHSNSIIETYDSKINAELHNGVTGLVAKYSLTITYSEGHLNTHTMVRIL